MNEIEFELLKITLQQEFYPYINLKQEKRLEKVLEEFYCVMKGLKENE